MRNLERATLLAANLHEFEVLTFCAISLADLQISRRDLAAAGATFDSCVRVCATIAQSPLRTSLMQRLLPKSMEVCNMQVGGETGCWRRVEPTEALGGEGAPGQSHRLGFSFH